uniref:Reverse transcriptase domain-containing protein n=1 Tax=Caenorhabditis japonica TaxID=281687 RepID=A0A8R1IKG6_CAEJA
MVLDASSHMKGELSLNQCVHPGPSTLKPFLGILLRAQMKKYILTADIAKAFHQIRLQEQDRDCTRFIWLKDVSKGPTPGNFITYRFTRIPFGISCSPFLLAASIITYLERFPSEINSRILQDLYVDNTVFTTNDENELEKLYEQSKQMFKDNMFMNLREYQTNSETVTNFIPEQDRAPNKPNKFLGHMLDYKHDTLTIHIPTPPK